MTPEKARASEAPASDAQADIKYGLPRDVKFCRKCVISNQRPNSCIEFQHRPDSPKATINFDADNVCDACRLAEHKKKVNWAEREKELLDILARHRRKDGYFDCIVPGSGGKDSVYAAHVLKYKYGMHPLTVTWSPHIYTDIGAKNFDAWIHSGFDNCKFTPNGIVHRLLTKLAVENLLHPFQPFILGQKNLAPRMSALWKVPLVFFGENEAEYGNPLNDALTSKRDRKYYSATDLSKVFLGGVSYPELKETYKLEDVDIFPYLPTDPHQLDEVGTEVHYLGYYLRWTPQECYYYAVENCGFEANPERTEGTYSKYNSLDDRIDGFHYYTTWIKFGIGRATYDAAQEIRNDHLTREEGVRLVRRFDGEFPRRYCDQIMKYLDMTEEHFHDLCDKARSPHLWAKENGEWKLRYVVQ